MTIADEAKEWHHSTSDSDVYMCPPGLSVDSRSDPHALLAYLCDYQICPMHCLLSNDTSHCITVYQPNLFALIFWTLSI